MRSTKQRLRGCKSRSTVVRESFSPERKTVLSLCCRAGCEDEEKKERKEKEEGERCRRRRIGMPRCYYSRSEAKRRRIGERVVIQDLSRSLWHRDCCFCCFKGYRISPPSRAGSDSRAKQKKDELRPTLRLPTWLPVQIVKTQRVFQYTYWMYWGKIEYLYVHISSILPATIRSIEQYWFYQVSKRVKWKRDARKSMINYCVRWLRKLSFSRLFILFRDFTEIFLR